MHIFCITSERPVHSYGIRTSGYFSGYTILYTGFLASLEMRDSCKLFAFYLRSSSGVGENSGTVLLCSLSVRAPEEMFEGHETYMLFTVWSKLLCTSALITSHG